MLPKLSVSPIQTSFAGALGGGAEAPLGSRHLGLRLSADYVFTHHNIFGGPRVLQNNVRAAVGLVFRFGSLGAGSSTARAAHAIPPSSLAIPQLGIRAVPREDGAQIVEVIPGSAAEFAGCVSKT